MMAMSAFMFAACNEANAGDKKAETTPAVEAAPVVKSTVESQAPVVQITDIDWDKALEMNKAGALLIDVRTPQEVAEGTAPGAINIPLQEIPQRLAEFPKDKDLLIFCRSGKRSMAASNILIQNGYEKVYNVLGGFMAFPAK